MNKLNNKGNYHGYWEAYFYNDNIFYYDDGDIYGDIIYKGNYINGEKKGYWEYYWGIKRKLSHKTFYL